MQNKEQEQQASVPYFIHEGQMARMERIFRIVSVAFLIALAIVTTALVINDNHWRDYCNNIEERYAAEGQSHDGVYQQPNQSPDSGEGP